MLAFEGARVSFVVCALDDLSSRVDAGGVGEELEGRSIQLRVLVDVALPGEVLALGAGVGHLDASGSVELFALVSSEDAVVHAWEGGEGGHLKAARPVGSQGRELQGPRNGRRIADSLSLVVCGHQLTELQLGTLGPHPKESEPCLLAAVCPVAHRIESEGQGLGSGLISEAVAPAAQCQVATAFDRNSACAAPDLVGKTLLGRPEREIVFQVKVIASGVEAPCKAEAIRASQEMAAFYLDPWICRVVDHDQDVFTDVTREKVGNDVEAGCLDVRPGEKDHPLPVMAEDTVAHQSSDIRAWTRAVFEKDRLFFDVLEETFVDVRPKNRRSPGGRSYNAPSGIEDADLKKLGIVDVCPLGHNPDARIRLEAEDAVGKAGPVGDVLVATDHGSHASSENFKTLDRDLVPVKDRFLVEDKGILPLSDYDLGIEGCFDRDIVDRAQREALPIGGSAIGLPSSDFEGVTLLRLGGRGDLGECEADCLPRLGRAQPIAFDILSGLPVYIERFLPEGSC